MEVVFRGRRLQCCTSRCSCVGSFPVGVSETCFLSPLVSNHLAFKVCVAAELLIQTTSRLQEIFVLSVTNAMMMTTMRAR